MIASIFACKRSRKYQKGMNYLKFTPFLILFSPISSFLSFTCVGFHKKITRPKRGLKRSHEGQNFLSFFFHSHFYFSLYLLLFLSPLSPSFKVHEIMDLRGHELSRVLSSLPFLFFLSFFFNSP